MGVNLYTSKYGNAVKYSKDSYTHMSSKLHHHKRKVNKGMLPNITGIKNSFTTRHVNSHLSPIYQKAQIMEI